MPLILQVQPNRRRRTHLGTSYYMSSHSWAMQLRPLLRKCKDKASVAKLHALMVLFGSFGHGTINGQLIASYARVGETTLARQVFDKTSQRGVHVWNAIVIAYSHKGYPDEVLSIYKKMKAEGVRPDSSTFTVVINACVRLMDLRMGVETWNTAVECGYEHDVFVASSVLNLYCKCGMMERAKDVFDKIRRKDVVCWTTMVTGYAQCGRAIEAFDIYRRMQKERIDGNPVVVLGLVQACSSFGDCKLGQSVHGYLIRRGLQIDVVLGTSLVHMYAKNGRLETAFQVFNRMYHKNVVSWGAMISGLAQNGFTRDALDLLVQMQKDGFFLDSSSLVSALFACSQAGLLKLGKSIHGYILRRFEFDQVSGTAVIDMYAKCGSLPCARALFDQINIRDTISWNAIIFTYGIHGHGKEALSLFHQMIKSNIKPDKATFASLLSALSHSGLVDEGRYYFDLMINKYMLSPDENHYACMIDLLSRAGQVKEALELLGSKNYKPSIFVWVALLSGCYNHAKLSIGERVAKKIVDLNPEDLGIYSLVANFYAMSRNWEGVASVRKIMKTTGMKKVPGYSIVEVNGEQHAFLMEDKSHDYYKNIIWILDLLDHVMKARRSTGYTELVSFDLDGVDMISVEQL